MVSVSKLTFGAYDVAPAGLTINPEPVSETPVQDKHGFIQNDLYGTKKMTKVESAPKDSYNFSSPDAQYTQYNMQRSQERKKGSLLGTLLVLGGLTAGGIYAYKKRKNISEAVTKFFKKFKSSETKTPAKTTAPETPAKTTKAEKVQPKRSPAFITLKTFDDYADSTINKAINDKYNKIEPKEFKVIFEHQSVDKKRESLLKLYELAKIYTLKDTQPQIKIIMPEAMAKDADFIVDMFGKNRTDELDAALLNRIEGFSLSKAIKTSAETNDMIVDKQVRHSVNAESIPDTGKKVGRNIKDFFKRLF
ncbi:MAG: hypothetical protein PHE78_04720 [Candidatus Gastranaerophilales bacterium]|nr:hypothetical protein [Candidatus Gastranaerophilales bacterium]